MKRFLSLALIAFCLTGTTQAARSLSHEDYVTRIESCEAILREFQADPNYAIPREVLQNAKAIVITNQFKAGFLFGVKDGYGLYIARRADGTWSLPAFVSAGEASFGLQLGGAAVETIFVLTNEDTARLLYKGRFNVGVDAAAVAGPKVAEVQRINKEILATPVLVYAKKKGLFAGATLKAGWLSANNNANRDFYNTRYSLPEIVQGDWVQPQPEIGPLMQFLSQIAP
ncbi:lipid-binding SYLF domain-containing protein [Synoicihabitans lomoniglobus]|uniref:Lipid-binding SYLF domain-containing protein n=1 Tax=Synoicihabitans lomoniglobus TaxID=2909285 RepID=A0AAE9ZRA7_9BACT|nr:lipid-binding SYLF domain-containing protein [Opitutaceae bacterium LMO-M01]WED63795.1 lipid-binding SYLF domain-containing protein [Opitutaceae bacterium LMO-M01]